MSTIFLRFPDKATFEVLLPSGFSYMGETVDKMPEGVTAISIIGQRDGRVFDANGVATDQRVSAFHVNATGVLPDSLKAYQIHPVTPDRVFGGH